MSLREAKNPPMAGFCTLCGHEVASFDDLSHCPNCGTEGVPCKADDQVTVSVNWHELHVLAVWAEQRAHSTTGGAGVVYAIAHRLEKQHPERHRLTLAGEVHELQDQFGAENVQTNIPGVEGGGSWKRGGP